jgi:Flp pilus assembly protein TadG
MALIAVALCGAVALGITAMSQRMIESSQAQVAADAAALAGVTGGERAATRLAQANGAELISYRHEQGDRGAIVTVVVGIGARRATASASDVP